jgi:hypothetical protein
MCLLLISFHRYQGLQRTFITSTSVSQFVDIKQLQYCDCVFNFLVIICQKCCTLLHIELASDDVSGRSDIFNIACGLLLSYSTESLLTFVDFCTE